ARQRLRLRLHAFRAEGARQRRAGRAVSLDARAAARQGGSRDAAADLGLPAHAGITSPAFTLIFAHGNRAFARVDAARSRVRPVCRKLTGSRNSSEPFSLFSISVASAFQDVKTGFGSMDPDRQREIAREGGRAAHEKG